MFESDMRKQRRIAVWALFSVLVVRPTANVKTISLSAIMVAVLGLVLFVAHIEHRQRLDFQLCNAVASNRIQTAASLLNKGANPNASLRPSISPWADLPAFLGLRRLPGAPCLSLAFGVYSYNEKEGWYVVTDGVQRNTGDMVRLLLEHGADPNGQDPFGHRLLLDACREMRWDTARLLLKFGADVNVTDPDFGSPLLMAAFHNDSAMVQALIDRDAEITVEGKDGFTPLKYAVAYRNSDMIRCLLARGADPRKVDRTGTSALKYAEQLGVAATLMALLRRSGK